MDQEDERVVSAKNNISQGHLHELDATKGRAVSGEILFFPERGFYAYTKCTTCKATAPPVDGTWDICTIDGCGGNLKNCYKMVN